MGGENLEHTADKGERGSEYERHPSPSRDEQIQRELGRTAVEGAQRDTDKK